MWNPDEVTPIGKTYAQIDKEQEEYIKSANEKLKLFSDLGGRWWRYYVSHCTFILLISDPLGEHNLVLEFSACTYISGPVTWPNQKLRIEWDNSPPSERRNWHFRLVDKVVGFKVEAETFVWEENYNLLDNPL